MRKNIQKWRFRSCWAAAALWLGAVAVGLSSLDRAALVPGRAGVVPAEWPGKMQLPRVADKANLIVFAHPLCPCTRATLHELQRLVASETAPMNVRVSMFEPAHPNADWSRGPLWDLANAIPGVQVQADVDGQMAAAFGAKTSGWAVLYDAQGRLRFAGGITAARGHEGDNAGASAIAAILTGDSSATAHTPVYGCALPNVTIASTDEASAP